MKNSFFLAAAFLFSAVAGAQTTPAQPVQDTTVKPTVLVDSSVYSAYVTNPEELRGLTAETLRPEHAFPALGSYTPAGESTENVVITLDSVNKGIVWVEGLSQGKFKAIMKKAPSTYKIPSQKSETGKSVAEGSLFLNPSTKELTIVLGRPFDDADPTSFLTISSKKKSKVWQYTGVKAQAPVMTPASEQ